MMSHALIRQPIFMINNCKFSLFWHFIMWFAFLMSFKITREKKEFLSHLVKKLKCLEIQYLCNIYVHFAIEQKSIFKYVVFIMKLRI